MVLLYVAPFIAWCTVQDDFDLMEIPLLESPKCWDYRDRPSKLVWWVSLVRGLVIGVRTPLVFCRLSFPSKSQSQALEHIVWRR